MAQQLSDLYTQAIENLAQGALESFELSSKRVMTDAKYPSRVRARAGATLGIFKTNCAAVTQGIVSVYIHLYAFPLLTHTIYLLSVPICGKVHLRRPWPIQQTAPRPSRLKPSLRLLPRPTHL